jgi:hypothetical protein
MKKLLTAACGSCAIASLAVTVHTSQLDRTASRTRTLTVTGCLRAWNAPSEARADDLAADREIPIRFILSKVVGEDAAVLTNGRYALAAGPSVKLGPLVDHRIEVTGTVAVASESRSTWTKTGVGVTPAGKTGEAFTLIPILRAQSIRRLSDTCP